MNYIPKKNPFSDLRIVIKTNKDQDKRVYNKPSASQIAVLMPALGENDEPTKRQGIVFEKNGNLKYIDPNNASYDAMQYTLCFPYGESSWEHNSIKLNLNELEDNEEENIIQHNIISNELKDEQEDLIILQEQDLPDDNESFGDSNNIHPKKKGIKKKMEFVSALQYYSYMLCDRSTSYLHRFGRLFHQYIVDQFSKIELARLNYFRYNFRYYQGHIRADLYQNIKDSNQQFGQNIGKRIVLPSTYKGSPRNMQQLYQDTMAVIRTYANQICLLL